MSTRIRFVLALTCVSLGGCSCERGDATEPIAPDPAGAIESPQPPSTPEAESGATTSADETPTDELARVGDPSGFSRTRASATHGARTYAVLERDLNAAGAAEWARTADHEALSEAYELWVGECLEADRGALRCLAAVTPHLVLLLDALGRHGSSWSVVAIEGDQVVHRQALLALSLHTESEMTNGVSLRVEDVDPDDDMEVIVEVPLRPLRDDTPSEFGDDESGTVAYILSESLAVQARWTSGWSRFEQLDMGDSPPESESCWASEGWDEGGGTALVLTHACEGAERSVRCPYDTQADRYLCPPHVADELLTAHTVDPHYVAQTAEELARALRLGSRVSDLRATVEDAGDEGEAGGQAPEPVAPDLAAPSAPAAPPPVACVHVVEDPAPPLHVRASPSSRADVVGDLDNGTELRLLERRGRWARIDAPSAGWLWTESLRERCP